MGGFINQASQNLRETPVASAVVTASGNSGQLLGYGPAVALRAQLNVTAVGGAPDQTLDVVIEDSVDGGVTWNTVGTFNRVTTAAARQVINVTNVFGDRIRVSWAVAGTGPSFTFQVDWLAITATS